MDPEKYAGQVDSEVRELLNDIEKDSAEISKVIRLVDYLTRLAWLHTKIIREVSEYENVLWIKDIPKQKGCFTQAWGRDEDFDSDIWIEIQTKREPDVPDLPPLCKGWIEENLSKTRVTYQISYQKLQSKLKILPGKMNLINPSLSHR